MLNKLSRESAGVDQAYPLKVLQFGGGNFLRGFVDWMIDILNEQTEFNAGVLLCKPSEGSYRGLQEQQGLYHVLLEGLRDGSMCQDVRLVKCIGQILSIYEHWDQYLKSAETSTIRFVVSNTTEAGIVYSPADSYEDIPPKQFPAKLTLWLYHRFEYFQGDPDKGCIFLPTELIVNNGQQLKDCILKYADNWNLEAAFKDWINDANYFCDTLVDRIVTGFPHHKSDTYHQQLGYLDSEMVAGELYHSWVIQGPSHVQNEMPFSKTSLQVHFVDDLEAYRNLKVRILNGAHTSMVPVGYLAGCRYVHEVLGDEKLSEYIVSLLHHEIATTLKLPQNTVNEFIEATLNRFRNPAIHHQLTDIALNSISKFNTRLLPSLRDYHEKNRELPVKIVFALASLIRFYLGVWEQQVIPLRDNNSVLSFFEQVGKRHREGDLDYSTLVHQVLTRQELWGEDLTAFRSLPERIGEFLTHLDKMGIIPALALLKQPPSVKPAQSQ